jgi:hypothetical protein
MLAVNNLTGFGGSVGGLPQYVASIQTFGTTAANKTISLTPLGLQDGDLIIIGAANDFNWAARPVVVTAGYTELTYVQLGSDRGLAIYYLMVNGTPPASVDVTYGSYNYAINIASYRYVNRTTPIHASAAAISDTASQPDPPSVTTTIPNTLIVAFGAQEDGISTTGTPPTNYITNGHSHESAGAGQSTMAMASRLLTDTGTENPAAFAFSAVGTSLSFTTALSPL